MGDQVKVCRTCGRSKALSDFHKNKSQTDGHHRDCKACRKAESAKYYLKNTEVIKKRSATWAKANHAKVAAQSRRKRARNPEKQREYIRRAYLKNPARFVAACAERYALVRRQAGILTPEMRSEILGFYEEARRLTLETGIPHEVDHIFPLKAKNSCGLHVPKNLRVITRAQNRRKSNKVEVEFLECPQL